MRNRGERLFKTAQIKERNRKTWKRHWFLILKDEGRRMRRRGICGKGCPYCLDNRLHSTRQREDTMQADLDYYGAGVYEWIYEACFE